MIFKKIQTFAQIVGFVCIGLLAIYGLVAILNGGSLAQAARRGEDSSPPAIQGPQAAPQGASALSDWGATVPLVINYQGTLRDMEGNLLSGTYVMIFRIYNAVDDPVANALWMEEHTNVVVRDGLFNVVLGDITTISPTMFDSPDRIYIFLFLRCRGKFPVVYRYSKLCQQRITFNTLFRFEKLPTDRIPTA